MKKELFLLFLFGILFSFFASSQSPTPSPDPETIEPEIDPSLMRSSSFVYYVELYGDPLIVLNTESNRDFLLSRLGLVKERISQRYPSVVFEGDIYKTSYGFFIDFSSLSGMEAYRLLSDLNQYGEVKEVHGDRVYRSALAETPGLVGADEVWTQDRQGNECELFGNPCLTGEGVKVAIIDSGIDYTHPDFSGSGKILDSYDFGDDDNDVMDDGYHGTFISGIVAGDGALRGIAPDASLYVYKVTTSTGEIPDSFEGKFSNILKALERAVDPNSDGDFSDKADVVLMSSGTVSTTPSDPLREALSNLMDNGVIVVASIGNDGRGGLFTTWSPGNEENVIGVGAVCKTNGGSVDCSPGSTLALGSISSKGPTSLGVYKPDLVAPGISICSAKSSNAFDAVLPSDHPDCMDNQHFISSGTSSSAAVVAGASALLKQKNPEWNAYQIKYSFKGTAEDIGFDGLRQGSGIINIPSAVNLRNSFPRATLFGQDDFFVRGVIEIKGAATDYPSSDFDNYVLEYSEGFDDGQTLMNWRVIRRSDSPLEGTLSTFDTSEVTGRVFTLRLRVKDRANQESVDKMVLFKKPDSWGENWPKRVDSFPYSQIGPVAADLDNDKDKEILVGIQNIVGPSFFEVYENDGSLLWRKELLPGEGSVPALGDLDGDGFLEIVYSTTLFFSNKQFIHVWDKDGNDLPGWPLEHTLGSPTFSFVPPSISDVDNDLQEEILVGKLQQGHFIYNHDGTAISGPWENVPPEYDGREPNFYSVDLDNDGQKEVVLFSSAYLRVWSLDGTLLHEKPVSVGDMSRSYLLFGNVDLDPEIEIIMVYKSSSSSLVGMEIIDGGSYLLEFQDYIHDFSRPILVEGSVPEKEEAKLVVTQNQDLFILKSLTSLRSNQKIKINDHTISGYLLRPNSILSVNMDSDQDSEILVSSENRIILKVIDNGVVSDFSAGFVNYPEFSDVQFQWPRYSGVTVTDINNDGGNEFVSLVYSPIDPGSSSLNSYIFVEDLGFDTSGNNWEKYKYDLGNSNNFPSFLVNNQFIRGDVNDDTNVDISDAIFILNYLFTAGSSPPSCEDSGDVNDDGRIDISDAISLLIFLFSDPEQRPADPYPNPGVDPTIDNIGC